MTHSVFNNNQQWNTLKDGIKKLAIKEVLSRFEKVASEVKSDGSLLTEADTQMQIKTQEFLAQHWPQYAFLGEESPAEDQAKALESPTGCWVLDPVDGTSNFASGIPFYSTSLALVINGKAVLGLIYDPSRDEMFAARDAKGAQLNQETLIANTDKASLKYCTAIVDFKRLPSKMATSLAQAPPFSSQRSFGSVALDWCWIAAGRGQVYCHGAQNIWDYAAGYVILNESGGHSVGFKGDDVFVARVEKRSAIAATNKALFDEWCQHIHSLK